MLILCRIVFIYYFCTYLNTKSINVKKKLIIGAVICVAFYLIGNIVPVKIFIPNIDWARQVSSGEFFYYFICTVQAIATVGAVIVALFNDSIKGYFRRPKLNIDLHNRELTEELDSNDTTTRKAKRYHNSIDIFNVGNINAEDCEICIDSIQFTGIAMGEAVELLQSEHVIYWSGSEKRTSTYIPVQGKKSFLIYEIFPPEEQSTPGGNSQSIPPRLSIANYKIPDEYCGGKWEVYICVYSPCLKPQKFKITIKWDGSWEDRQMEMRRKVKNEIICNI